MTRAASKLIVVALIASSTAACRFPQKAAPTVSKNESLPSPKESIKRMPPAEHSPALPRSAAPMHYQSTNVPRINPQTGQEDTGAIRSQSPVAPVAHTAPIAASPVGSPQQQFASHPHAMMHGPAMGCPPGGICPPTNPAWQQSYMPPYDPSYRPADEYICDGGDRETTVRIGEDWSVRGLNLEDTIGHYDTLEGERLVEASNRVCIYAPRFAAVRKVHGALENEGATKSAGVDVPLQIGTQEERALASTTVQQIQPTGQLGRDGTVTFLDKTRGVNVDNAIRVVGFDNTFAAYEDFQVIKLGIHQQADKARLARFMDAAAVWTKKQAVSVLVDGKEAVVQMGVERAQVTERYDDLGKPKLRVCKVASTDNALPGEFVEFTLRFDNIGTKKMGNVTIIDNLTTRLEYVEGSAECSLKADFFSEPNEGESLVLRWEIIDPLDKGEGGVIRFKCRVR